jgi:ribosomal protein S3AE
MENDTMEKTKKMTKRDHFNALLKIEDVKSNEALVEFINHEIDLLNRKNSIEKKPTAQQVANEGIKKIIMDVLQKSGEGMTVTEIIKAHADLSGLSNQRVSALLRQMIGISVEKFVDKGKSYFKAV